MTDLAEPAPPAPRQPLLRRLGPRAERRMTPRISIAMAGAGALIAVGGALGIGGDRLVADDGDLQRLPGVAVSLLLVVAGMAVLQRVPSGAISTAGSIGAAIGIPALLVFATVDDGDFPPFAFDATLLVATLAWLAAYLLGPARGRMLFLALALVAAPIFVIEQVEEISEVPETIGQTMSATYFGGSPVFEDDITFDDDGFPVFPEDDPRFSPTMEPSELLDPTNIGLILLVFGAGYVLASQLLSRRGWDGAATPPVAIGAVALVLGTFFLSGDLEAVGVGLVLVAIGLALAAVGALAARRFTTWFGGGAVGIGVIVLVSEALGDDVTTLTASVVFLLVGIVVVLAGHLIAVAVGEAAEEDQRRSLRPDAPRAGSDPGPPPAI